MTQQLPLTTKFITSFLRLTRFWNLLIIGLAQYFSAGFLIGASRVYDFRLFLLMVSTTVIAAAGYIINDYYDVKIDFINKPNRVVIGKSITRRYAIMLHVVLSATGVLIGTYLSLLLGAMNAFCVFLLWFYSNNLKRQPLIGNLAVALLTGLSILVIDVIYPSHHGLIWIYAVFAFFMTLVREIIKDMEDLKGDNTFGCKTLPIVWGLRRTKFFIYFVLALFCIIVVLINKLYVLLPFGYFVAFLFLPLLFFLVRLIRADMKKDFARLSTFCKIILLLGIISMAFV